jgi:hypothetical protein
VIGAWLADRDRRSCSIRHRRAVAVDGKTLPGARGKDGRQGPPAGRHGARHPGGAGPTAGQRRPGEVPGLKPLLEALELTGAVVTADLLHTHAGAAAFLVGVKRADYLLTVKANQPTLLDCCQRLAWHRVPVLDRTAIRPTAGWSYAPSRPSACAASASPCRPVLQITHKTPQAAHPPLDDEGRLRGHQPVPRPRSSRPPG